MITAGGENFINTTLYNWLIKFCYILKKRSIIIVTIENLSSCKMAVLSFNDLKFK